MAAAKSGGRRAATTLVDQSFSSVSNFAVGVAVARVAGASGLGAFSLAYAAWQVLAAMHRSLITDPMAIEGDIYHPDGDVSNIKTRGGIERGFAAEVLLGVVGACIFALAGGALILVGARTFGIAMLAMAPWLPVLLIQDYWRWVGFMTRRPGCALANDTVFNCVQGAALAAVFVVHTHSIVALIACWGLGSAAGALYGLRQYRVLPKFSGGLPMLRAHWKVSKWLAGVSLSGSGGTQLTVFIVGAILGPAGLGGLKAAQTLVVGPSGVLIMAGGSIGLPEASKAYAEKGWSGLTRVARLVTAAGFLSFLAGAVVVALFGRTLLSAIYGPSFAHLELAAVFMAIAYVVLSFNLGPILVLKSTRNTRSLFHIQLVTLAVSLASVTVLSLAYGVNGAAASTIVIYLVSSVGAGWVQHKVGERIVGQEAPEPPGVEEPLWHPIAPENGAQAPVAAAVGQSPNWDRQSPTRDVSA
jgi:O-antigen/teichoic acid export membrane protein